ncbi:MAG: hypothetical protein ACFB03_01235 [Paracoccaceae bacterium]
MPKPILSPKSRVAAAQADRLLKCYAERLPPSDAAKRTGLSLNSVYEQYSRIRWRLIEVGYYRDAALSKDEDGLSELSKEMLRERRGLSDEDVYAHSAEIIEWAEEWPSGTVLRQLRKIIELTGPIDVPLDLTGPQAVAIIAYVRYARTKLIHDRVADKAKTDETQIDFAERTKAALEKEWRAYRAAVKKMERTQSRKVKQK